MAGPGAETDISEGRRRRRDDVTSSDNRMSNRVMRRKPGQVANVKRTSNSRWQPAAGQCSWSRKRAFKSSAHVYRQTNRRMTQSAMIAA